MLYNNILYSICHQLDTSIKRKVIQQWLSGCPLDKIASDNDIGEGTVSSIVSNYKIGLETSEFDSVRDLSIELRKQGLTLSDLAPHLRLYNFFRSSGASEEEIESFVANSSTDNVSPEKVIGLVNQLHDISKEQSIPVQEIPEYIGKKLDENQKIDEQIKEADGTLQRKNVNIESINEHLQLNEKLKEHGLSTQDIDKLLNLLSNAKRYGFDGKEIASKLYNIQELEWKEKELRGKCKKLSKRISKYKDVVPLTEDIAALKIGIDELISLKVGINQAAKLYNLPPLAATLQLINDIKNIIK
jgi:DNA-binding transcriptional MerR regulator